MILETRQLRWPDEAACAAAAHALAARPGIGAAFIELRGELGAGKTTWVRHLLRALGVEGRVKSPTYALMEPYDLPALGAAAEGWHFDFYRFDDPREWEDAGFRDIFASDGLKLVEWPEKAAGLLPAADLRIEIVMDANGDADPSGGAVMGGSGETGSRRDAAGAASERTVRFIALSVLGCGLLP